MPTGIYDRSKAKPRKKSGDKPQAATGKKADAININPVRKRPRKPRTGEKAAFVHDAQAHIDAIDPSSRSVQLAEPLHTWLHVTAFVRNTSVEKLLSDAVTQFIRGAA
jgi:GTP cyclohydrolase III